MIPRSVRSHLFQVLLVCVLPLGVFAGGLLYFHWQAQERQRENSQIESARLLATALDNAIDSTVQRISLLAGVWAASPDAAALIHAQARAALADNPDWASVLAFSSDGTALFRTDVPYGTELPRMKLMRQWSPVLTGEQRALVTDVFTAPMQNNKAVAIGVPVLSDGKATHVLIASLNLRWFDGLVTRQGLAGGGVAGIFDRNWKFLARSAEGDARRGTDPSQPLIEDMKRNPEGIGRYSDLNGRAVYTSWAPSRHGWWVAFATPAAPVDGAFWTFLGALGLLWAVMLAVGVAYAVSKGRHIASALESVEARARDLAAARRLERLPASRVEEVSRALRALEKASETLQAAMRERDDSLLVEQQARAAAEAANRAKDEFLAMLGHELRNPLAAISSAALIMRSRRHTAQQIDFAGGVLERQTRHLTRLIDDLLDVGRVVTGKVMLERAPLDLAACLRQVVATLQTAGRFAQRQLKVEAVPLWIDGDQTRIEQIVTNLLSNAASYTAPDGTIRVRVAREERDAVLEVSDDGRGIAPESLERVFELFYQADTTIDRASGGLGIGLTLVRRLTELHGGTVSARSAGKGKGASFVVRLPAIAAPSRAELSSAPARPGAKHVILIVEDNDDQREGLRVALELEGHSVLPAPDGHAGLELLHELRPPIAILDIGLPGMNGYEFARMARATQGAGILLIAVTGYGSAEDEQRARAAGFDYYLTKPAFMDQLLKILDNTPVKADARSGPAGRTRASSG